MDHVRHAFALLKPGGRLVAITSESCYFGSYARAKEFQYWIEATGAKTTKLSPDAFKKGPRPTSVQTRLLVVNK